MNDNNNIRAYVLSGAGDDDVRTWLKDYANADIVNKIVDANLVVFTGGSDVTPSLYGEANVHSGFDYLRDKEEMELFDFCRMAGIPMFGICRGSQFLHVMMGGSLWQDVTDHCCQHDIIDTETGYLVPDTTSTHHQMVRMAWDNYPTKEAAGFTLVAEPCIARSKHYQCAAGTYRYLAESGDPFVAEVEAYRYAREGTSIMAIQGHPEWGGKVFATWAGDKLADWHKGIEREPNVDDAFPPAAVMEQRPAVGVFDRAAYQAQYGQQA